MTDTSTRTDTPTDGAETEAPTTVESRSFRWSAGFGTSKVALFRVRSAHAVRQHVRTVTISQRAASTCEIDTDATLDDIPEPVLDELRTTGHEVVAGGAV
jgi:hypothetical protein